MRWHHVPPPPGAVERLAREASVGPVVAELLLAAGLDSPAAAAGFLRPSLATISDPFLLANLAAAASSLVTAIELGVSGVVLGDCHVDGVTSTALLAII